MYNPKIHRHKMHKFMNLSNGEVHALDTLVWTAMLHYKNASSALPDGEDREEACAMFLIADHVRCFTGSERDRRRKAAKKGKAEWLTPEEQICVLKTGTTMPEMELSDQKGMTFQEYQTYRETADDKEETE